jgi:glycosyltransferase involved in cell wall biosynthesis
MQSGGLRAKGITKQSQKNMPLITVVTVVYNAGKTLEETILSVINQMYKNIEYIIVDGASTDNTLEIIKKYENEIDCWVSEPDDGIYYAMNKGIDLATGEWLIFINGGDLFFEKKTITSVVNKMIDAEVVYYGDVYMTKIRKIYLGKFNCVKLAIGNICHQAIFYPKCIYASKKYLVKYKVYADYHYNLSIFRQIEFRYLDETIAIYEYVGFSSLSGDCEFEKTKSRLVLRHLGIIPLLISSMFCSLVKIKMAVVKNVIL